MKKTLLAVCAAFLLASCAGGANMSGSSQGQNILVVGEDADRDSVPRSSSVFRRVTDALVNELHNEGFNVYDETAVTMGSMAQGRVRRSDAELIDVARMTRRPPIDTLVIFQIYPSAQRLSYTTKVRVRVTGRILAVQSGRRLGNFEVETPRQWNAPKDCSQRCIVELVGEHARTIAAEVGAMIASRLSNGTSSRRSGNGPTTSLASTYSLIFEGFTPKDMFEVEDYLEIFRGYQSHRTVYSGNRRMELSYHSTIGTARLRRNLSKMLKEIGVRGRVGFSGNEYTVTKISRRKVRALKSDDW